MCVEVPQKKGLRLIFSEDAFPKPDTTLETLAKLRTICGSPTVTPGNAPGLDAGSAGLLIMSGEKAKQLALKPLATVRATASVYTNPTLPAINPADAIKKVLAKVGMVGNENVNMVA